MNACDDLQELLLGAMLFSLLVPRQFGQAAEEADVGSKEAMSSWAVPIDLSMIIPLWSGAGKVSWVSYDHPIVEWCGQGVVGELTGETLDMILCFLFRRERLVVACILGITWGERRLPAARAPRARCTPAAAAAPPPSN